MTGVKVDAAAAVDPPARIDAHASRRRTVRVLDGWTQDAPWLCRIASVGVVVVFLGVWELAVREGWQSQFWVSRPTLIAQKIGHWVQNGTLADNLIPTLKVALISFLISGVGAVALAALMHSNRWLDDVFGWYLNLIYAIPKPALVPLFIFAFGLGDTADYILVITFVFFVFYFNVRGGLAISRRNYEEAQQILGAKRRDVWLNVTLPFLVPFLVASSRFGLPLAILGTVFAEFFTTSPGMGRLIVQAQYILDSTTMLAGVVVLIIMGMLIDGGLRYLDRRVSRWRVR